MTVRSFGGSCSSGSAVTDIGIYCPQKEPLPCPGCMASCPFFCLDEPGIQGWKKRKGFFSSGELYEASLLIQGEVKYCKINTVRSNSNKQKVR